MKKPRRNSADNATELRALSESEAMISSLTWRKSVEDPVTWAIRNIKLPRGMKWDFSERMWQIKLLDDMHPFKVIKKSAQVGLTTISVCNILHSLSRRNITAMYTLPRRDDITDFAATTLDPIINGSPYLESILSNSDSVRLKQFSHDKGHMSFLHITEASVEPRMLPVDMLVNDEIDRSDPDFLQIFRARLDNSPDPHHYQFSTPTLPGFGIDVLYDSTTKSTWFVRCSHCGTRQKLDWEINFTEIPEPRYICYRCQRDIEVDAIVNGEWVDEFPGRDIHGYHVSHMMMPITRPPSKLSLDLSSNRLSKRNFYNLKLGLAYSGAAGKFSRDLLANHLFAERYQSEIIPLTDHGRYYIGADQGNDLHIVVVKRVGKMNIIVRVEKIKYESDVDGFTRLIQLIRLYRARFTVLDAMPNTHSARTVWMTFRDEDRVAMCHYTSGVESFITRNRQEGRVLVGKTEAFDGLQSEIARGDWRCYGPYEGRDDNVEMMLAHLCNLRRDEKQDASGVLRGFWIATGADHYGHALSYARVASMIAESNSGLVVTSLEDAPGQQVDADNLKTVYKVWPSTVGMYDDDDDDDGSNSDDLPEGAVGRTASGILIG